MGWSCSGKASDVLEKISNACYKLTGISNRFYINGVAHFFETSRTEHRDGAITGTIWKCISANPDNAPYIKRGNFRINGNGTIARMPKALRTLGGI